MVRLQVALADDTVTIIKVNWPALNLLKMMTTVNYNFIE